jgi:hypothetical protein
MPEAAPETSAASRMPLITSVAIFESAGAITGAAAGTTFTQEGPDTNTLVRKEDLESRATDIRTDLTKKESALDLLDDVMKPDEPTMVELKKDIRGDKTEIKALTAEAKAIDTSTNYSAEGIGIGAGAGMVAAALALAVFGIRARRQRLRQMRTTAAKQAPSA